MEELLDLDQLDQEVEQPPENKLIKKGDGNKALAVMENGTFKLCKDKDSKLYLVYKGISELQYEIVKKVLVSKKSDSMYGIGHFITTTKTTRTDEASWNKFSTLIEKVIEWQRLHENGFAAAVAEMGQDDDVTFYGTLSIHGLYEIEETNGKMKFTLPDYHTSWIIDQTWQCTTCEADKKGLILISGEKFLYFELFNETERNDFAHVINNYKLKFKKEFDEETMDIKANLETIEMQNELNGDREEEVNVDDTVHAPLTGKFVFPKSKHKKIFHFATHCGKTTQQLRDWLEQNLDETPPPHWRNMPGVQQVTRKFVQGDPIENAAADELIFHQDFVRPPISRPADYQQRRYPDYV